MGATRVEAAASDLVLDALVILFDAVGGAGAAGKEQLHTQQTSENKSEAENAFIHGASIFRAARRARYGASSHACGEPFGRAARRGARPARATKHVRRGASIGSRRWRAHDETPR